LHETMVNTREQTERVERQNTRQACVSIVADLLAMEIADPGQEIKLYLNSPESVPYYIFAIIDVINQLKCPVSTVAFGMCGGASALLLAAGTKGRRTAMPNSRILVRVPPLRTS
jgi:ATP-dependent Clp protease protease subunit